MSILPAITAELMLARDMNKETARNAALELAREGVPLEDKKAFLTALSSKGETAEEVAAFAATFRTLARGTGLDDIAPRAIDIVGTGGSGSGSFNISSAAAMVVAAAGVPVLKHGNRAITSQSGAADFLSAFGVPQTPSLAGLRKSVEELNFCFLFAPNFHPAFKEIMPVRKALAAEGLKTIFNILGPLINPAKPAYELLGVMSEKWVAPLGGALGELGLSAGLAVHGRLNDKLGVDEFSTAGDNYVAGFGRLAAQHGVWTPEGMGFARCPAVELVGGTAAENVASLKRIARGVGSRGIIDTLSLNAGAALWIAGAAPDLSSGCDRARGVLTGGDLALWMEKAERVLKAVE